MQPLKGVGARHLLYRQNCNLDERMDLDVLLWRPALLLYIPRELHTFFMDVYGSACGVGIPVF